MTVSLECFLLLSPSGFSDEELHIIDILTSDTISLQASLYFAHSNSMGAKCSVGEYFPVFSGSRVCSLVEKYPGSAQSTKIISLSLLITDKT